jgi:pimeloyl-[acyl-carrier protein] methyl ester esterase
VKLASHVSGKGPGLLLIHGWGMNAAVWQPLLRLLEEDFRITRVELPGHGASPWDDGLRTLDDWTEAVLAVAPERALWAGWSLGGLIMQRARALAPERLSAALGIATTPCFAQREDWPHGIDPRVLRAFAVELQTDPARTLRRFLALQVQGAEDARATLAALRREFDACPAPHPRALDMGLKLLLDTDLRPLPEDSTVPLHWLLGERDTLVPASLASALPGTIEVIPGAAHAPFLSHPERCAVRLREIKSHV